MPKKDNRPRNIYGQAMGVMGTPDRRAHNGHRMRENGGKPYVAYDVLERPGDSRWPWVVIATELAENITIRISRHRTREQADRAAELLRIRQPGRNPSKKYRNKLGLPVSPPRRSQ